jgi:subtilase family serine protease
MLKRASPADVAPSNLLGSGPNGWFLGSDMRAAYAPGVKFDGSGQMVGLFELGPYNLSDVQMYFSTMGQSLNVPIYNMLLDVDGVCSETPYTGGCDDSEEALDIEQAISMAPNLSGLIVYETYAGNDPLAVFAQMAADDLAKQLSISWLLFGLGPSSLPGYEQIFMEFQAQGQSLFASSGDYGSNLDIAYPQNSPNVTDVGGTDLTTASPGGPWQSESAWALSGGGWNILSPIPSYQTLVVNASNQGSTAYRNIPDVAMEANSDNYICANGICSGYVGGTSISTPRWAGFMALANQQANGTPIGFLNPTIYRIGQASTYDTVFHDITTGTNFSSGNPNLFPPRPVMISLPGGDRRRDKR